MFFGTPEWAVPSLERLIASDIDVAAVVTNPDRPAGRGMKVAASPVAQAAREAGLEVIQVATARDPELTGRLASIGPDVAVVVAYGKILPGPLLEIPPKGFVNLHFSLLPLYRGAAPVQHSIMNGDATTGVSVMVLTEGMDEGPVLARREEPIDPNETSATLGSRLAEIGADVLVDALDGYLSGSIEPEPQDDAGATYAPKIVTEDARIDWTAEARVIHNLVRALDPEPGAWTTLAGVRLKVFSVRPVEGSEHQPGTIAVGDDLVVGTGSQPVALIEVQPATKKRMSGSDFARGARVTSGTEMGD